MGEWYMEGDGGGAWGGDGALLELCIGGEWCISGYFTPTTAGKFC